MLYQHLYVRGWREGGRRGRGGGDEIWGLGNGVG